MPEKTLILFDIDMTLLSTQRAGMRALQRAGRELFGDAFTTEGVDYAGRIDPLIVRDMLKVSAVEPTPGAIASLRDAYFALLPEVLHESSALPGAHDLVNALEAEPSATLGLLTGNYETSGRLKLGASGFDADRFEIRVWGDDSPCDPPAREHLPPVALDRSGFDAARTVIIGDTPHDVSCAHAHGIRALAVATGSYSEAELERAERVTPDLTFTRDLVDWIISR